MIVYIFILFGNIKEDEIKVISEFNRFKVILKKGLYSSDRELVLKSNKSYSIAISDVWYVNMVKFENI